MKSYSSLLRILFFFYLSIIIPAPLVAQNSKVDLQSLKALKKIMIGWQSQSYKNIETQTIYETIKKYSKSSLFLMDIYNAGLNQYQSLINDYNERKNNEPQLSYDVMTEVYKNTLRAKDIYLNKVISISGTITSITKNVYGEPYFVVDPLVQCYFRDTNVNDIKKLNVTESVNVKGKVVLIDWQGNKPYMQLSGCEIVPDVNYEAWLQGIRNESVLFWNKYLSNLDLEITKYEPIGSSNIESTGSISGSWNGLYVSPDGQVKIENERQGKFKFSIEVSLGHYSGDISGTAQITSTSAAMYKDDCGNDGKIIFTRNNNKITVKEYGCVSSNHGANIDFNGTYKKFNK